MRLLLILCVCLISSSLSYAEAPSSAELDDLFALRTIAYRQNDKGKASGNPHIREDAAIYEGIMLIRGRVNDNNAAQIKVTGDLVTAASYDDAREKAETVSGATGYNPGRWNIELGWKYLSDSLTSISAHASYGQEFAYRSSGAGFSVGQSFAEGATQLQLDVQYFDDTVRVIHFDGSKSPDARRKTQTINLGLTQSLTPNSALNFGLSHTDQSGFLATSFNAVLIDEVFDREITPSDRTRDAWSVRYKYGFPRDSIQLGYSYYQDNWDIKASTIEFRYFMNLREGNWRLEPTLRYYTQSAAEFFAFEFDMPQSYQSSDPDLGDLSGHSMGISSSFKAPSIFTKHNATYEFGFNYYQRSDNLDFYWLTFGWSFPI